MTKSAGHPGCVFCAMGEQHILARNGLAYTVRDTSPVTPLHTLILPKRHMAGYFDLDTKEKLAIDELLEETRRNILTRDPRVAGFNIGINVGGGRRSDDLSLPFASDPAPAGRCRQPERGMMTPAA